MAVNEALSLNGLALNSGPEPAGAYTIEAVDLTPPKKKAEWAQGADSDGAGLIRDPLYENRTVTAKIRIEPQTTMNVALEKLAAIVDQLQEAQKNPGVGIPLVWTPSQSTKTGTMYVLSGEPTGMPLEVQGDQSGWFVKAPILTIQMVCKPFIYGPEEEVLAAKANETGLSVVTFTLANIKGDVRAEGRLVVTDTAAKGRRYMEWGLEQRYYNPATKLVLDSEDMTPVGGTQTNAFNALGAYKRAGATNGTIGTFLVPEPTICCNTGVLAYIGTFRVKLRMLVTLSSGGPIGNVKLRLSWQDGEGPMRANAWQTATGVNNTFVEVDLGTVTATQAAAGAQKWLGQIEAYSGNTAAKDVFHVDYLTFIPVAEGYGKARGVQSSAPGTVTAFDNFTTGTLSGSLNARTPAVGAAWATSGATGDWTVTAGATTRATTADASARQGVLGAAIGNSRAAITGTFPFVIAAGTLITGVLLRRVDASNFAFAWIKSTTTTATAELGVVVAGVTTVIASQELVEAGPFFTADPFQIDLTVTLDGALSASFAATGLSSAALAGSHSSVATGGVLASGKGGIYDFNTTSTSSPVRSYKSIAVSQLAAIPYCIQPSQSMEVHSDSTIAEDSTGTYYGPVPQYRGSRFYVPPAGAEKRTSRVLVKADRNDLEESDQQTIGDGFTVQCFVTPRYLTVPR